MKKARFYLVRLPIISITIFFFCCVIAALIHPGSHKEIIGYQSDYYSFTHNFLSELGSLQTNTDETNPAIIQKDNTPSMLLFNGSLILIGATLMLFYVNFKKVFGLIEDSSKSIFYSKITMPVGLLAGFFYAGVGLVPHDLHFEAHVFFANYAFLTLFILCILHSLTVYHSNSLSNNYVLGYVAFCIVLFIYLRIIFYGPQIGPGKIYSETDLMLQVIAQKSIVLTFMAAILHQVYGFNVLLNKKR
ncbi:DUF998 domain-containing protein [Flavobacteriaceae bacterium]|nr:DUF998 domain-containing protein [Flavobacteriaceae bacterium]MDB4192523.1 DUF998 domain-containing protein [Flavobacteriaceae bacterium]MDB9780757.1 DUF998 domain-containing protein [Flavobacteriaceae bacterium]